jgi:hypothetical protein
MNSGGEMKYFGKFVLGMTFLLGLPVLATSSQLERLADRLANQASDLAARSYNGFNERDRGNRADVEVLYLTQEFSSGVTLLRQMVSDHRPESELRNAVQVLLEQARNSERYAFARPQWDEMQRDLWEIGRELNLQRFPGAEYESGWRDNEGNTPMNGRMHWRGRVDDGVYIAVQGGNATVRAISGDPVKKSSFTFTSPLPQRRVSVELKKLKGRGAVELVQQPSRDDDFTAVVQIRDDKGGSDEYEFELFW